MSVYQEMGRKGYFSLQNTLYGRRSGVYYQMYKALNTIDPATGQYYLENTDDVKRAFMREREYANTNWFKELFTHRPIHTHTVTFSGGGRTLQCMLPSVFMMTEDGLWPTMLKELRPTSRTLFTGTKIR